MPSFVLQLKIKREKRSKMFGLCTISSIKPRAKERYCIASFVVP